MANFEGVFIPVTTPFRGDDVAPERLAANLQRLARRQRRQS